MPAHKKALAWGAIVVFSASGLAFASAQTSALPEGVAAPAALYMSHNGNGHGSDGIAWHHDAQNCANSESCPNPESCPYTAAHDGSGNHHSGQPAPTSTHDGSGHNRSHGGGHR